MYAVIGRMKLKPGREHEERWMIADHSIPALQGRPGWSSGYWSRCVNDGDLILHSFWLFDTEEHARTAAASFNMLRDMPEPQAPATFISVDVTEVVGQG
jgi:hypothetical protein